MEFGCTTKGRPRNSASGPEIVMAPQVCRSTNRQVAPEVWFRIVHIAQEGHNGGTVGAHRGPRGEKALGPKAASENGNIGALTRRVPTDRLVAVLPPFRGTPKLPRKPRTLRVVELLRKAIEWQILLESGKIANQAAIARREGITRARVTQVMGMLRLAPEIQEHILSMPDNARRRPITERMLRPLGAIVDDRDQ